MRRVQSPAKSLDRITRQLVTMRSLASAPDDDLHCTAAAISGWCPAEHLDHLAKVSTAILRRLSLDPAPIDTSLNLLGRLVLGLGWIPRGRGKSPKSLAGTRVNGEALRVSIAEMDRAVATIDADSMARIPHPVVPHPRFGGLTPAQALRFVAIHNEHHLRIVADIAAARSAR